MRILAFALGCWSLTVSAFDFPALSGRLHNPHGLDLSKVGLEMEIECSDAKAKCGTKKRVARFDAKKEAFTFAAVSVGPAARRLDYFTDGWGKRYDFTIKITGIGNVAHDFDTWCWEARPSNTLPQMVKLLNELFEDVTLYPSREPSGIRIEKPEEFSGKALRLQLMKQFLPNAEGQRKGLGILWLSAKLEKFENRDEISLAFEPVTFAVWGSPDRYGDTPKTRTVLYLYAEAGEKKFSYKGYIDEMGTFSPDALFSTPYPKVELKPYPRGN